MHIALKIAHTKAHAHTMEVVIQHIVRIRALERKKNAGQILSDPCIYFGCSDETLSHMTKQTRLKFKPNYKWTSSNLLTSDFTLGHTDNIAGVHPSVSDMNTEYAERRWKKKKNLVIFKVLHSTCNVGLSRLFGRWKPLDLLYGFSEVILEIKPFTFTGDGLGDKN